MLDGAVAVFDGVAGVEPQSETVWRQADKYGVPGCASSTSSTAPAPDFYYCVQSIVDRLGATPLVLTLPIGAESDLKGVVDLVRQQCAASSGKTKPRREVQLHRHSGRPRRQGCRISREKLVETRRRAGRRCHGSLSRRQRARRGDAQASHPQGHAGAARSFRSCAVRRSRTRASSPCSTRLSITCRRRLDVPAIKGVLPDSDEEQTVRPSAMTSPSQRLPSRS